MAGKRMARRVAKGLGVMACMAAIGVGLLFAALRWEHDTAVELPVPSGHDAVGRTSYTWVNAAAADELAPPGTKRVVVAWIWYPAAKAASGARAATVEYLPAAWRKALAQHSGVLMSGFLTRDLALVRAHSIADAAVSPEQKSYPVVILRAGGGALTTDFTTLAEDLSSHGYFVVGFDAPYRTGLVVLPDGRAAIRREEDNPENLPADQAVRLINRLLRMWVEDTKFVVGQLAQLNAANPPSRFTGRMNLQELGMFGHSFGGAQALEFCHEDAQCKAGIDLDGAPYGSVVQTGLKQPFMFILSDHSRDPAGPENQAIRGHLESIYRRLPNGRLCISIRKANHFSFSDQMLQKSPLVIGVLGMLGFGGLDGRRGLAITADYVHTFFDVYLKGAPAGLLRNISTKYPEVAVERP